jgi:hypothetical protein
MKGIGGTMKCTVAFLFQIMIWSGFKLAAWLSGHDPAIFTAALFIIFLFIAFALAKSIVHSLRAASVVTVLSLAAYGLAEISFSKLIF